MAHCNIVLLLTTNYAFCMTELLLRAICLIPMLTEICLNPNWTKFYLTLDIQTLKSYTNNTIIVKTAQI